jgi:hypothetical protein
LVQNNWRILNVGETSCCKRPKENANKQKLEEKRKASKILTVLGNLWELLVRKEKKKCRLGDRIKRSQL